MDNFDNPKDAESYLRHKLSQAADEVAEILSVLHSCRVCGKVECEGGCEYRGTSS